MNCHDIHTLLPDLTPPWPAAVDAHLAGCQACARQAEAEGMLRDQLQHLPGMMLRPSFEARLRQHYAPRRVMSLRRFGATVALAASLLLAVLLVLPERPQGLDAGHPLVAEERFESLEVRTVHLQLKSAYALDQVVIRLEFPEGVELDGYRGQRVIEWTTTMQAGVQVLSLPLVGHSDQPLVATLQHRSGQRRFETPVVSTRGHSTGLRPHHPEVLTHA